MAYLTTSTQILKHIYLSPASGNTLTEQLENCYEQFNQKSIEKNYPKSSIVKQTVFIPVNNNTEYIQSKLKLIACAKDFFTLLPPTSIIAQSPENGSLLVEFTILEGLKQSQIFHHQNNKSTWIVIEHPEMKMIFATGSGDDSDTTGIMEQSETAFKTIQKILSEEKMEFSDIIRQWNYIEQILMIDTFNDSSNQHYQIFNDVRSKYYNKANFSHGFPSATGIGADCGGIIIDIIAVKIINNYSVVAIKSPVQLDAYSYSKKVLAENNIMKDFNRTTPKFERAKILVTPFNNWIFISGTAAIKGETSIPIHSVEHQTEMTIKNILSLISVENLKKHGINTAGEVEMNNLRVYIKYPKDIESVKELCTKYFSQTPVNYVVADICRPELLVEIEGFAVIGRIVA
jgi:enamine deaminase RidA (YjgF/YER057c/UK114 family)